jgi:hypothetical protein
MFTGAPIIWGKMAWKHDDKVEISLYGNKINYRAKVQVYEGRVACIRIPETDDGAIFYGHGICVDVPCSYTETG